MEILFVIDNVDNLDKKISLIETIGADIKFFVDSKYVSNVIKNKKILDNIIAIFKNNINETIDKYIQQENYVAKSTIIYHSSVDITVEMIEKIRQNLQLNPDTIYVKKKMGFWSKFKLWVYNKIIKFLFGIDDEFASTKLQYFSEKMMSIFQQSNFKNHIFTMPNALTIEIDKQRAVTYYNKPKFNKNYLYNPIVICLILIVYAVLETFFKLQFWIYLLFITLIISVIVNWITMIIKNNFDVRFKK
jgi:hypothetical protein